MSSTTTTILRLCEGESGVPFIPCVLCALFISLSIGRGFRAAQPTRMGCTSGKFFNLTLLEEEEGGFRESLGGAFNDANDDGLMGRDFFA